MPASRTVKSMKAALVGQKVLAGLDRGRQIAIAQARARSRMRADLILDLAAADALAGRTRRGRAGRIARKLAHHPDQRLSESQVRKILRALSSVRDSPWQNPDVRIETAPATGGAHVQQ